MRFLSLFPFFFTHMQKLHKIALKTAGTQVYSTHPFETSPPGCLEVARLLNSPLSTHPFETTGGAYLERVCPSPPPPPFPSRSHSVPTTHPFETSRSNHAGGVAILFEYNMPIEQARVVQEKEGSLLIIHVKINDVQYGVSQCICSNSKKKIETYFIVPCFKVLKVIFSIENQEIPKLS